MNKVLNDLRGYELRNTKDYDLKKGNVTRDLRVSDGPIEITKGFSEVIDMVNVMGILSVMGGYMRSIRSFVNSLRLVDETAKFEYANDNLRRINTMNKILEQETTYFRDNHIHGFETKFYAKYENMKQELKENKDAIIEQDRIITSSKSMLKRMERELKQLMRREPKNSVGINNLKEKMHKKEFELYEARVTKLRLGLRRASLKNLSEKNVVDMARDINRPNRNGIAFKILGGMARIAADIVIAMSLPISKVAVTALQMPLIIGNFFKALDRHIFRKLREKSEFSRKEQMVKEQMKNINKEIGTDRVREIIADEKDAAKQLEKIEKTEDKEIKCAFEASKRAQNVLCAKPSLSLRMFKIKAIEDNERLENTAKFILKQIKELPDEDKAREMLEKYDGVMTKINAIKSLKQAEQSKERIKTMLEVLGIDNADDFINDVKEYKRKKSEDLAVIDNNKAKMNNAQRDFFAAKKNNLKDRLVEAMKQKL